MAQVELRFYEELNDFLSPPRRKVSFAHELTRRTSVKDLIESFGVPHTEVEVILANGDSVDFSYIVRPGDRISVYPTFESLDVNPLIRLRDKPLRNPRFVLDANLGQLARYLRLLGFDVIYRNDFSDREVAHIAQQEKRIVLTRDRALLQHKIITHGYFVRADRPRLQVREVLARLQLHGALRPFTRCVRCNGELESVDKQTVLERLEPKTRIYYEHFRRCKSCGQAYWRGSHFARMEKLCDYFATPPSRIDQSTRMSTKNFGVRVECNAGYSGEERPRRLAGRAAVGGGRDPWSRCPPADSAVHSEPTSSSIFSSGHSDLP